MKSVFQYLMDVRAERGAGYFLLIDPDRKNHGILEYLVTAANEGDVDAILVGGSLFMDSKFHERAAHIKKMASIPVILFPGGVYQLGPHYDAVIFMSVISGRNANNLIGEQVISAPLVKDLGLEPIPTGYMLFDGGGNTTVEFISNTRPLPMNRINMIVAHGLAAQYLGMKILYLEAGSGAERSIREEIIQEMVKKVDLPLIVGGGIRTPEDARKKVESGASFIVTGSVAEESGQKSIIKEFADAIHGG